MSVGAPEHPQDLLKIQIFILVFKNKLHSSWIKVGFMMNLSYGFK